jgi:hypothetical protein
MSKEKMVSLINATMKLLWSNEETSRILVHLWNGLQFTDLFDWPVKPTVEVTLLAGVESKPIYMEG